jgi:hypothetical protein
LRSAGPRVVPIKSVINSKMDASQEREAISIRHVRNLPIQAPSPQMQQPLPGGAAIQVDYRLSRKRLGPGFPSLRSRGLSTPTSPGSKTGAAAIIPRGGLRTHSNSGYFLPNTSDGQASSPPTIAKDPSRTSPENAEMVGDAPEFMAPNI